MNAKKWSILFTGFIVLVLLFIAGVNFFVDPFGYFRMQDGNTPLNASYYMREAKAEHLKAHPNDYDAYLVGGSKAGALRTEKLSELDGYRYYNCWIFSGNFQDYYNYSKYIIENNHPKKLILHISTSEIKQYNREGVSDLHVLPATITGESKTAEVFKFLFKNLSASWDDLQNRSENMQFSDYDTGERNLGKYYKQMQKDPSNYYNDYVSYQVTPYMKRITKGTPDKSYVVDKSIADLKAIKEMCDKNDVEFQVVFGSLFLGEMIGYEGESLYDFLEQAVQITGGFWCFNTFNDVAYNSFNYYNAYHYLYETGDLMIDTMNGKGTYKDFGVYLTMDNISQHIKERRKKMQEVRNYYVANKALPFKAYDDASNYKRVEKEQFTNMESIK